MQIEKKEDGIMWFLVTIILIVVIYFVVCYNRFVKFKNAIDQSSAGINVYLKQRFELIPNLVKTVKEYANYEKEMLERITTLRTEYLNSKKEDINDNIKRDEQLQQLIVTIENYPQLKSSEQFLSLQKSLTKTENQLQAARRIYNIDVTRYNTAIQSFPNNIISSMFKFKQIELYNITDEEKKNISIDI